MIIKICKRGAKKNTSPCRVRNAVDPVKCALKRVRLELAALNFRPGAERTLPARCADRSKLPFSEHTALHARAVQPLQLMFGDRAGKWRPGPYAS